MCAQTEAPLHPQRRILDIITVGAFTRHHTKRLLLHNTAANEMISGVSHGGGGGLIK